MGELGKLSQSVQANLSAGSDIASIASNTTKKLNSVLENGVPILDRHNQITFVGINENGIEDMKSAIDKYCNAVESEIDKIVTTAQTDDTFRGEYAAAITEFVIAVKNSALYNVGQLRRFKEDLEKVRIAYKAKDASIAGNVTDNASTINSSVESN